MRGCTCPRDGSRLCDWCQTLLVRTGGAPPPLVTHAQMQARLREICKRLGWRTYHTYRSTKSEPGFPDFVCVRPATAAQAGRLLFVELKTEGDTPTIPQQHWLEDLAHSVAGVEVHLWYPADFAHVVEVLQR